MNKLIQWWNGFKEKDGTKKAAVFFGKVGFVLKLTAQWAYANPHLLPWKSFWWEKNWVINPPPASALAAMTQCSLCLHAKNGKLRFGNFP